MALNQNQTGSDVKNELTVEQGVAEEEVKEDIIENGEDLKIEIKNIFSMSNKYNENPYQCSADGCDYIARDNSLLKRHIGWKHTGILIFSIQLISLQITIFDKILSILFFSDEKPFECKLCHMKFPQRFSCIKHLKSNIHKLSSNDEIQNNIEYHNIGGGENSRNNQSLLKLNMLSLHAKVNHDSNSQKNESPNHQTVLNEDGIPIIKNKSYPYRCVPCQLSFSYPGFLTKHIGSIHPNEKNAIKVRCDNCDQEFDQYDLNTHINGFPGGSAKCYICDKTFLHDKNLLKKHIDCVHYDIKSYKCEICSAYFSTPLTLRKHSRIHLLPTSNQKDVVNDATTISQKNIDENASILAGWRHMTNLAVNSNQSEEPEKITNKVAGEGLDNFAAKPTFSDWLSKNSAISSSANTSDSQVNEQKSSKNIRPFQMLISPKNLTKKHQPQSSKINANSLQRPQEQSLDGISNQIIEESKLRKHFLIQRIINTPSLYKNIDRNISLSNSTNGDVFNCQNCEIVFITQEDLKKHVFDNHPPTEVPKTDEALGFSPANVNKQQQNLQTSKKSKQQKVPILVNKQLTENESTNQPIIYTGKCTYCAKYVADLPKHLRLVHSKHEKEVPILVNKQLTENELTNQPIIYPANTSETIFLPPIFVPNLLPENQTATSKISVLAPTNQIQISSILAPKPNQETISVPEILDNLEVNKSIDGIVSCQTCKMVFITLEDLEKHVLDNHSPTENPQKPNQENLSVPQILDNLQVKKSIQPMVSCQTCKILKLKPYYVGTLEDLEKHVLENHSPTEYPQKSAIDTLTNQTLSNSLINSQSGQLELVPQILDNLQVKKSIQPMVSCQTCKITFITLEDLEKHVMENHSNPQKSAIDILTNQTLSNSLINPQSG